MRSLLICLAAVLSFCALSYAGYVPPGAVCTKDSDCVDNAACWIPAPCDNGTCVCNSNYYFKAAECEAKIANGDDCTSVGAAPECVSGMCKGGKCFVKGDNDADCTDGTDCTSGYCKAGTPTNKCAAKKALGDYCTVNEECMTGKCGTGAPKKCVCQTGTKENAAKTMCVPEVDLDADCVIGSNAADCEKGRLPGSTKCEVGAKCVCKYYILDGGYCSEKQTFDGTCTANAECETGKCTNLKCKCMDGMTWDATKKMCERNKIAKDGDCMVGDVCMDIDQTCAKCQGQTKYTCQDNKMYGGTTSTSTMANSTTAHSTTATSTTASESSTSTIKDTSNATMIAVSLTTLFTSILALVL